MALSEFSVVLSCLDRRTRQKEQLAVSDNCQLSRMINLLIWLIKFCFARERDSRLSDKARMINPYTHVHVCMFMYVYVLICVCVERQADRYREPERARLGSATV